MNPLHIKPFMLAALLLLVFTAHSQDKIYRTDGRVIKGKVTEVGPKEMKYTREDLPNKVEYKLYVKEVDSIVYANGASEELLGGYRKKKNHQNIPQLNTWNLNILGAAHLSLSQAYERRIKDSKIGLRIPVHFGFGDAIMAGIGTFNPPYGGTSWYNYTIAKYDYQYYNVNGPYYRLHSFSFGAGFNPKFYLNKHRKARAFIGPEADIGFVTYKVYEEHRDPNYPVYPDLDRHWCGTAALMGTFGVSLNPKDKFNITVHGAAGAGNVFGGNNPVGWTGVWQIGLSMGTNW